MAITDTPTSATVSYTHLLSVGRSQQYIKEDWADEKRKKGALREVY